MVEQVKSYTLSKRILKPLQFFLNGQALKKNSQGHSQNQFRFKQKSTPKNNNYPSVTLHKFNEELDGISIMFDEIIKAGEEYIISEKKFIEYWAKLN